MQASCTGHLQFTCLSVAITKCFYGDIEKLDSSICNISASSNSQMINLFYISTCLTTGFHDYLLIAADSELE